MKIVTLNLRHDVDRWNERLPLVVEALVQEDADIIALQEVALTSPQAQQMADCLAERGLNYVVFVAPKWGDEPREGIGIFSRLTVIEYEHLNLPHGQRIAQRIRIKLNGKIVNIANVHLHHRPRANESIRVEQMQAVIDWMKKREPTNWILTGDLNAQPDSQTVQLATTWLQSAHNVLHGMEPVTHPTPLNPDRAPGMQLSIDYILYDTTAFQPIEAYRWADKPNPDDATLYPSDHYGVSARFVFMSE